MSEAEKIVNNLPNNSVVCYQDATLNKSFWALIRILRLQGKMYDIHLDTIHTVKGHGNIGTMLSGVLEENKGAMLVCHEDMAACYRKAKNAQWSHKISPIYEVAQHGRLVEICIIPKNKNLSQVD